MLCVCRDTQSMCAFAYRHTENLTQDESTAYKTDTRK